MGRVGCDRVLLKTNCLRFLQDEELPTTYSLSYGQLVLSNELYLISVENIFFSWIIFFISFSMRSGGSSLTPVLDTVSVLDTVLAVLAVLSPVDHL